MKIPGPHVVIPTLNTFLKVAWNVVRLHVHLGAILWTSHDVPVTKEEGKGERK